MKRQPNICANDREWKRLLRIPPAKARAAVAVGADDPAGADDPILNDIKDDIDAKTNEYLERRSERLVDALPRPNPFLSVVAALHVFFRDFHADLSTFRVWVVW